MKNIRIISPVEINGKHVEENTIVENVDNALAAELVAAGRAVVIPAKPKKIEVRDPLVDHRDLKPEKPAKAEKSKGKEKPPEVDAAPEE